MSSPCWNYCRELTTSTFTRTVDTTPTHVPPRPPPGPPRLAPRLPRPRLPTPRLPAPRLPARCHLPARCPPCHHRLIARRIRARAAPLVPCRHHACLPARYALRYALRYRLRESSNLRPCDPVTLCDSAPTHSVLRRRRPTRKACHLSPPTRGSTLSVLPLPLMLRRERLSKLSNTKVGAKPSPQHDCPVRCRSQPPLPAPASVGYRYTQR